MPNKRVDPNKRVEGNIFENQINRQRINVPNKQTGRVDIFLNYIL